VAKAMAFGANEGTFFWSNGDAWGTCRIAPGGRTAELEVIHGALVLRSFRLGNAAPLTFRRPRIVKAGETVPMGL
jgi:non-lysosomal glucosylceramidase